MASYHFSAQVIQRSKGKSAIAAAAYRSGSRLYDEGQGRHHDFSRRRGVIYSAVMLPDSAPAELFDRQVLWSRAEAMERRRDAQVARELNIALPRELDFIQRQELILKFVQEAFVDRGMAADVAIHEPVPGKNSSPHNHHAHVMLAMRRVTRAGLHPVKTREWNSPELLKFWRALWARRQNEALEAAGHIVRVDHRTLVAQRDDALKRRDWASAERLRREAQVHVGPRAQKIVERGRVPRSVDRARGPAGRRPATGRRIVRYTAIDRGSRVSFHGQRAKQRSVSLMASVARWQARSARLRLRAQRLRQRETMLRVDFARMFGSVDLRWLERVDAPHTLRGQVRSATEQLAHVRRRRGQLDALMREVDRTLARLLLSHSAGPGRRPLLLQSNNPQRRPGRSRARYPIGPSTFPRDNA